MPISTSKENIVFLTYLQLFDSFCISSQVNFIYFVQNRTNPNASVGFTIYTVYDTFCPQTLDLSKKKLPPKEV